jgi:hypothetical protein
MPKKLLLVALLAVFAALVALVRPARVTDPLAPETLARLLAQPVDRVPGAPPGLGEGPTPFWKALLAPPLVELAEAGRVLPLGRVVADPSAARGSAESAGELLELEAVGPDGPLGVPLWRALLERAAVGDERGRTLSVYGCRHSADPDAGPVLEDTYHARVSIVQRLRALAEGQGTPLVIRGEQTPVKGGVNLEVQLDGERQWVRVTFDGNAHPPLRAERKHRPPSPNDARARTRLVAALRALAAEEPALGTLSIEGAEAAVSGGVDVRLEIYGGRLSLVARRGATRLSTHLVLDPSLAPSVPPGSTATAR